MESSVHCVRLAVIPWYSLRCKKQFFFLILIFMGTRNHMWSTVATEKTPSPKLLSVFSRVNRIQEFRKDNPG